MAVLVSGSYSTSKSYVSRWSKTPGGISRFRISAMLVREATYDTAHARCTALSQYRLRGWLPSTVSCVPNLLLARRIDSSGRAVSLRCTFVYIADVYREPRQKLRSKVSLFATADNLRSPTRSRVGAVSHFSTRSRGCI